MQMVDEALGEHDRLFGARVESTRTGGTISILTFPDSPGAIDFWRWRSVLCWRKASMAAYGCSENLSANENRRRSLVRGHQRSSPMAISTSFCGTSQRPLAQRRSANAPDRAGECQSTDRPPIRRSSDRLQPGFWPVGERQHGRIRDPHHIGVPEKTHVEIAIWTRRNRNRIWAG